MKSFTAIVGLMLFSMAAADLPYNIQQESRREAPVARHLPPNHPHRPTGTGYLPHPTKTWTTSHRHTHSHHPTGTGGPHDHPHSHIWVPPTQPNVPV